MAKELYINPVQAKIRESQLKGDKKLTVAICGRGTGKSTIIGDYFFNCIDTMPRSRGWLGGPDLGAVQNRSLPSIQEHWERMGLIQDQDYVIGKKPPSDWDTPFSKVEKHTNIISFWNGASIDMVSFYNDSGGRGPSYVFGAGDEMGWVKRENFAQNIIPAMRGLRFKIAKLELLPDEENNMPPFGQIQKEGIRKYWMIPFQENPYYQSMLFVSSMPYLAKGKWLLEYEHDPNTFYIEGTALDNIEVVGPDYIPTQQAALTQLEFDVEIMNKRFDPVEDGFYNGFDDNIHTISRNPYNPDLPINLGFDFGKFTGCVVEQTIGNTSSFCNVLYNKHGDIDSLMDEFLHTYKDHTCKEVQISGDVMGNKAWTKDNDMRSWFDVIEQKLREANWGYYTYRRYQNPPHADKHLIIKKALHEKTTMPVIRIYAKACKALILSFKNAPLLDNLTKDKKLEHPDSPIQAEHTTHLSDAFDYLYIDNYANTFSFDSALTDSSLFIG